MNLEDLERRIQVLEDIDAIVAGTAGTNIVPAD